MSQRYTCGHAPEVMCRECHPEAFDNTVDLNAVADPHDACKETIKARERSITDLRYRVKVMEKAEDRYHDYIRELENQVEDYHRHALHVEGERDEWKAKAEQAQHAEDINRELYEKAEKENEALKDNRDYWKDRADIARKHEDEALQALSQATHYCCYHMRWETQRGEKV